jgi:hypothetical protein
MSNPVPAIPEKEIGGISAMLVAELFNLNPRLYACLEALLGGDPESAMFYLQREVATRAERK